LLVRFGPREEFLAGDLAERYARGKSRAWYWRQVLGAILVNIAEELRAGKAALLRGWLSWLYLETFWNLTEALGVWSPFVAFLTGSAALRWAGKRSYYSSKKEFYVFFAMKFLYMSVVYQSWDYYRPSAMDVAFGLIVLAVAPAVFFLARRFRRDEGCP